MRKMGKLKPLMAIGVVVGAVLAISVAFDLPDRISASDAQVDIGKSVVPFELSGTRYAIPVGYFDSFPGVEERDHATTMLLKFLWNKLDDTLVANEAPVVAADYPMVGVLVRNYKTETRMPPIEVFRKIYAGGFSADDAIAEQYGLLHVPNVSAHNDSSADVYLGPNGTDHIVVCAVDDVMKRIAKIRSCSGFHQVGNTTFEILLKEEMMPDYLSIVAALEKKWSEFRVQPIAY